MSLALLSLAALPAAHAASSNWNVDAPGNWADPGNWSAGVPGIAAGTNSTDVATFGFSLTVARAVTVDTNRNIGGITFSNTSGFGYTLSGGSLRLSNNGVIQTASTNGNHTDTISSAIQIQGDGGAATFTADATSATSLLTISGGVTGVSTGTNVTTLTLNGANTSLTGNEISGIIGNGSGGGSLAIVKSDAGAWRLSGVNTYSGGTEIRNGTLVVLTSGSALGTGTIYLGDTGSTATDTTLRNNTTSAFANNIVVRAGNTGTAKLVSGGNIGSTFNGSIELNKDLTLETNNANNITHINLAGPVSGAGGLIVNNTVSDIRGSTLSGANTFSGGVTVNRGLLRINNGGTNATNSALGTGTFTINNVGGSVLLDVTAGAAGSTQTMLTNNAQIWNGNFTYSSTRHLNMGTGAVSLGTATGTTRTLTVGNTGAFIVGGGISNGTTANSLTKAGTGTLELTGDSGYTGGTTVSAGLLLVNNTTGSGTGTGGVSVGTGGTLGGSGYIFGEVTVNSGGALAAGNSTGVLTMGGLDLQAGATTTFEIDGALRGSQYDGINITTGGPLDFGGSLLFDFGNVSAIADASVLNLFDFNTVSTGDFSSLTSTGFYAGTWNKTGEIWSLVSGSQELQFSETTGDLTFVPEPSTHALLVLGMGALCFMRRKKRAGQNFAPRP